MAFLWLWLNIGAIGLAMPFPWVSLEVVWDLDELVDAWDDGSM